jgi:hypothetical protein
MSRRLCALLVCALVPVGVVTGCGSSGTSTTKSSTTEHTSTTATSTVPLTVRVNKAIADCHKEVRTSAYIPAGEKAAGEADCEGVKTGNVAQVTALRTMLRDACELEVTEKVPADEKTAADEACKKVY